MLRNCCSWDILILLYTVVLFPRVRRVICGCFFLLGKCVQCTSRSDSCYCDKNVRQCLNEHSMPRRNPCHFFRIRDSLPPGRQRSCVAIAESLSVGFGVWKYTGGHNQKSCQSISNRLIVPTTGMERTWVVVWWTIARVRLTWMVLISRWYLHINCYYYNFSNW